MLNDINTTSRYQRMLKPGAGRQRVPAAGLMPSLKAGRTGDWTEGASARGWESAKLTDPEIPASRRIWKAREVPVAQVIPVFKEYHGNSPVWDGLLGRLAELSAALAEEGASLDERSRRGLRRVLDQFGVKSRPFLTARHDGRLRALWENTDGEQIGVQFINEDVVHYVLFSRRGDGVIFQTYGTGDHRVLQVMVENLGLSKLL